MTPTGAASRRPHRVDAARREGVARRPGGRTPEERERERENTAGDGGGGGVGVGVG